MQTNAWGDALYNPLSRYIQSSLGDIYYHRPKVLQPLADDSTILRRCLCNRLSLLAFDDSHTNRSDEERTAGNNHHCRLMTAHKR